MPLSTDPWPDHKFEPSSACRFYVVEVPVALTSDIDIGIGKTVCHPAQNPKP